jgi:Adenylate kinase and related kinases
MRKIFIVGIVASGKTTLAKQLSKQLQIPWYELDSIVHHRTDSGRYKRTAEEQLEVIKDIDRNGAWILEGTDRDSYQYLYQMAEKIIFVDTPLGVRRWRILARFLKQKLGLEPCHYKPDLDMLRMMFKWTGDFERNKTAFEAKLRLYEDKLIRYSEMKKERPNGLAAP